MALRYMSPRSSARFALLLAVLAASATPAMAQLCPGVTDPCVISTNTNVASETVLDIGTRGLVIAPSTTVNVQGAGVLTIRAGSVTLETNAKIVASGANALGGIVTIVSKGPFSMQAGSQIDVGSGNGGSVDVTAETGDIVMNGRIKADGSLRQGYGGDVSFTTLAGNITLGGLGVNTTGGDVFGGGGALFVDAFGSATLAGTMLSKGSDGGDVEIFSGGDTTVQNGVEINLNALDVELGDGGDMDIDAGGDLEFGGTLIATASGDGPENGGGDGGYTDFLAIGDILISGTITANGSADGAGGDLDLDGMNVTVTGAVTLTGPGQGDGGDVFLLSTGTSTVNATVDVRAAISGGAFGFGGSVDVISDGPIVIGPAAVMRTTGTYQAGSIDLFGCDITIEDGALLESLGPGTATSGTNVVQASGVATIGGVAEATTGNQVFYREFMPTIAPQAGTSPAWVVAQKPTLPCCIGCPTTTTTSTTTSTSSTSTTSTSTSSTSTSTSSTTSTSMPGATTSTSISTSTSTSSSTTSSTASTTSTSSSTSTTTTTVASTSSTVTSSSTSSTATTLATTTTIEVGTTTTTIGGTTTTTLSLCDGLAGFEAAGCQLGILETDVAVRSDDELGGKRPARGLRKRIEKSVVFLQRASVETKAKKTHRFVKRSRKKLESFEKKVVRFTSKGKIVIGVADPLLSQADEAKVELEAIEAGLSQQ
jgi:hypothetical protein